MNYHEHFTHDPELQRRGNVENGPGNGAANGAPPPSAVPAPATQYEGQANTPYQTRHDGWTPEIRVKFLEALANCGNVQSAVYFVQRSRTSAYKLRHRDGNFALGWDAALLLARDVATDTLQDRAINGVEEEVYYRGEVVATRRRYESRLLLAHIARLDKLAENIATSRAAARFGDVTAAIAAEEDTAPLITEPTAAEVAEQERRLDSSRFGSSSYPYEELADEEDLLEEPVEMFACTFEDDPPEIHRMTRSEADALADDVAGLSVRALDGEEAVDALNAARARDLAAMRDEARKETHRGRAKDGPDGLAGDRAEDAVRDEPVNAAGKVTGEKSPEPCAPGTLCTL